MNAESVKARLKNFAKDTGHTFQEALIYYGLERTIYRISVSEYAEHFVLKGGIFLYAIFGWKYERATTDIDFLARRISNSGGEMKAVFQCILSQEIDDALVSDSGGVTEAGTTQRDVVREGVVQIGVTFRVSKKWLNKFSAYKKLASITVGYLDTETMNIVDTQM